jgi:hypothetical protein
MRTDYEDAVATNQSEWNNTADPLALVEVLRRASLYQQPLPAWAEEAVIELITASRTANRARRHRESVLRQIRHATVCEFRANGATFEKAYEGAHERLRGTAAAGSVETMKADYARVERDQKAGRHDYRVKGVALTPKR